MTHTVGFEKHNHRSCMTHALEAADAACQQKGLQFTAVRRRVLEILLERHRALGAYDILPQLSAENLGSQPPVVYRALDFLVEHGFVHKVQTLNAFVACSHPGTQHSPVFMICRACEAIVEACSTPRRSFPGAAAKASGFQIEETIVEAEGLCPACQSR